MNKPKNPLSQNDVFAHFKSVDPVFYEVSLLVYKEHGDKLFELKKPDNLFETLCESIVSQQLSVKAGDTIFGRVLDLLPGRKLTPENILMQKDQDLRDAGLSWGKVSYLKDLAQKVKDKEVVLEDLDKLSEEEAIKELTKIKGIGKWTAEMFLMFALGREDVFSHGDVGLQNAIKKIYKDRLPFDKVGKWKYDPLVVEEIIIKWSPYRTIAARILWRSLALKEVTP
jgi:DNA-3-methyladenine glycosylase II